MRGHLLSTKSAGLVLNGVIEGTLQITVCPPVPCAAKSLLWSQCPSMQVHFIEFQLKIHDAARWTRTMFRWVVLCFLLDPSAGSGIRLSWDSDMNRRQFLATSAAAGLGRGLVASSDGSRIDRVALVKRHSPAVAEADIHPPRSFAAMRKKRLYFANLLNQNFCIAFANSVPSKNFRTNSGGETLQRGSRTRISYTLPPMLIPIRRIVMYKDNLRKHFVSRHRVLGPSCKRIEHRTLLIW